MKRALIIKDSKSKIVVHDTYLHVRNMEQDFIIGYIHISALYINKSSDIPISDCFKISQKIPLYLIDHNGYIHSQLKKITDDEE